MAVEKVFKVLTEFQFEIQGAVAQSGVLQEAVGKISGAADTALFSLNRLGGFISSGLGVNLGLFSLLGAALKSSENFQKNVLSFSNILGGNLEFLQGDVAQFNDRLLFSGQLMKDIAKAAREFGLNEDTMLNTTKMMAALLIPKGLAGDNLGNAVNMARMFEKSAPVLGVDTMDAQGQLIRAIEGSASMGDTLFRRLASETSAFSGMRGKGNTAKQFNALDTTKRFDLINRALAQFSSDANITAGNAGLLSNKLMVLKNQLIGIDGVLKPIGDTLSGPIKMAIDTVSKFLDTKGKKIAADFSKFINGFIEDPAALYVNLKQASKLQQDVRRAGKLSSAIGLGALVMWLGRLAMSVPMVNAAILALLRTLALITGVGALAGGFAGIKVALMGIANAGAIASLLFKGFAFVLGRILVPLALFTGIFQVFSRAMAIADLANLKYLAEGSDKILPAITRISTALGSIFRPFALFADRLAQMIAPLFEINTYAGISITTLEGLATAMEWLSEVTLIVVAGIYGGFTVAAQILIDIVKSVELVFINIGEIVFGFAADVIEAFGQIKEALLSGDFSGAAKAATNPFMNSSIELTKPSDLGIQSAGGVNNMFDKAVDSIFEQNLKSLNDPNAENKNVSNKVTNIGKVEIRNEFRENAEPDRIAHSLLKVIVDAAKNPTQAAGRSLQGSFVR